MVFTGWCWFLWKSPGCFSHQSFLCLEFNETLIYLGKVVKPSIWPACHAKVSAMLIVNDPLHTGLWNVRLWKSSGAWQLSLLASWVEMCPWKWQPGNQTDSAYPLPDRLCTQSSTSAQQLPQSIWTPHIAPNQFILLWHLLGYWNSEE